MRSETLRGWLGHVRRRLPAKARVSAAIDWWSALDDWFAENPLTCLAALASAAFVLLTEPIRLYGQVLGDSIAALTFRSVGSGLLLGLWLVILLLFWFGAWMISHESAEEADHWDFLPFSDVLAPPLALWANITRIPAHLLSWYVVPSQRASLGMFGFVASLAIVGCLSALSWALVHHDLDLGPVIQALDHAQGGVIEQLAVMRDVQVFEALAWAIDRMHTYGTEPAAAARVANALSAGLALAVLAVLSTLWFGSSHWDRPHPFGPPNPGRWTEVTAVAIILVTVSGLVGVALHLGGFENRFYSLWAVQHLCLMGLMACRSLDAFGRSLLGRLMLGGALAVVLLAGLNVPVFIGGNQPMESDALAPVERTPPALTSGPLVDPLYGEGTLVVDDLQGAIFLDPEVRTRRRAWYEAAFSRLEEMSPGEPVVFVAASGGGSRAALFATLVLETLSEDLSDQVLFISSVSGGSVATAHYLFGAPAGNEPGAAVLEARDKEASRLLEDHDAVCLNGRTAIAEVLVEQAAEGAEPPTVMDGRRARVSDEDEWPESPAWHTSCAPDSKFLSRAIACHVLPRVEVPPTEPGPGFGQLATDFNKPLLQGMVLPGVERGVSMTREWASSFRWEHHYRCIYSFAGSEAGERECAGFSGTRPLMLTNLTDVKRGTRVVAGFPRLPSGMLGAREGDASGVETARVNVADAKSITDLDVGLAVTVEEAVRMSANFPWGFDVPKLGLPDAEEDDLVYVVDGGVLDNTGIDALFQLLLGLERIAADEPAVGLGTLEQRRKWRRKNAPAGLLLDELALRGVLVLEIDSGAKPEPPGWLVDTVLGNLLLPIHSLSMSGFVRASDATSTNTTAMNEILRRADPLHPPTRFNSRSRLEHVVYSLDTEDIMTAWALTPQQQGKLLARFDVEHHIQQSALRMAYDHLTSSFRDEPDPNPSPPDEPERSESVNERETPEAAEEDKARVEQGRDGVMSALSSQWNELSRLDRAVLSQANEMRSTKGKGNKDSLDVGGEGWIALGSSQMCIPAGSCPAGSRPFEQAFLDLPDGAAPNGEITGKVFRALLPGRLYHAHTETPWYIWWNAPDPKTKERPARPSSAYMLTVGRGDELHVKHVVEMPGTGLWFAWVELLPHFDL